MKTIFICLLIICTSFNLYAQTFAERVADAYLKTDQNFDLDCYYSFNRKFKLIRPVSTTLKELNRISRDFVIESGDRMIPMNFSVLRKNRSIEYRALINQEHVSSAKLSRRDFYLAPIKDQQFSNDFETSKIFCNVNFAYAYPHELRDGTYHISVHPHKVYDWQSRLTKPIETYLNNEQYESIILLETGNLRGGLVDINKFLDSMAYKLPSNQVDSELENVPVTVPLIVSPAGNNRFVFKAKSEINVTFTGGNHNYCIWNSTRHILEGLMNSTSEARVNIYYDTQAIVAQTHGIEKLGLNFNRKEVNRSNLLKDLLSRKEIQNSYHTNYLNFFRNYFARQFSGMYRTYKINYKAEGFETSVTLQGLGNRNLEVNLTYL